MSAMPTTTTLGLIEAFDRHGALLARAPITRWPVTVGRALDCDLVLDDPFVAPRHLRIDRAVDEPRTVQVEVLETRNGARLQRKQHAQGERFDWPDGTPIDLGHTHLHLRLADAPIAEEQALPQFPWRTVGTTAVLAVLVLLAGLGESWLEARDAAQYLKALPLLLLTTLAVVALVRCTPVTIKRVNKKTPRSDSANTNPCVRASSGGSSTGLRSHPSMRSTPKPKRNQAIKNTGMACASGLVDATYTPISVMLPIRHR